MQRILVKAARGLAATGMTFGAGAVAFKATPLFSSIGQQPALGAAAGEVWYVLTPPQGFAEENIWDLCHSVMQQGFGVAGASAPVFAEPDLEQKWLTGTSIEGGQSLVQSCEGQDKPNPAFPRDEGNPYWFRDSGHSQFDDAILAIGGPPALSQVRHAHPPPGYDPHHPTPPHHMPRDPPAHTLAKHAR